MGVIIEMYKIYELVLTEYTSFSKKYLTPSSGSPKFGWRLISYYWFSLFGLYLFVLQTCHLSISILSNLCLPDVIYSRYFKILSLIFVLLFLFLPHWFLFVAILQIEKLFNNLPKLFNFELNLELSQFAVDIFHYSENVCPSL